MRLAQVVQALAAVLSLGVLVLGLSSFPPTTRSVVHTPALADARPSASPSGAGASVGVEVPSVLSGTLAAPKVTDDQASPGAPPPRADWAMTMPPTPSPSQPPPPTDSPVPHAVRTIGPNQSITSATEQNVTIGHPPAALINANVRTNDTYSAAPVADVTTPPPPAATTNSEANASRRSRLRAVLHRLASIANTSGAPVTVIASSPTATNTSAANGSARSAPAPVALSVDEVPAEYAPVWSQPAGRHGAGLLFFAYGATRTLPHFLEEAVAAARSCRALNPDLEIAIVTNNASVDLAVFTQHIRPRQAPHKTEHETPHLRLAITPCARND